MLRMKDGTEVRWEMDGESHMNLLGPGGALFANIEILPWVQCTGFPICEFRATVWPCVHARAKRNTSQDIIRATRWVHSTISVTPVTAPSPDPNH